MRDIFPFIKNNSINYLSSIMNNNGYHFCTLNETQLIKSLPPLNFVQKLTDISQIPVTLFDSQQRNKYDRKNHILYINNFAAYERILREKYGRSVDSFEKQLKMMGFKKRKIREHNVMQEIVNNNNNLQQSKQQFQTTTKTTTKQTKYMLVWKTNRSKLIEQEMEGLQHALEEEIERAIRMREEVEKSKRELDARLDCVLLAGLGGQQQQGDTSVVEREEAGKEQQEQRPILSSDSLVISPQFLYTLQYLRSLSNRTKQSASSIIKQISKCSQSQLQLYRALIYKQTHILQRDCYQHQ